MKTSTLDLEELQTVNPTIVLEYLKSNSWVEVESKSTDQYLILKHLTQDKRDAFTLLPLDVEIPDFASRMFDLIKVVSIVEQRSQAEIFNSIKSAKEFAEEKDRDILK
jgi:hypothetical protein